jgi:hypothetical protein
MNQPGQRTETDVSLAFPGLNARQTLDVFSHYVEARNFEAVNRNEASYRGVRGCIGRFPYPRASDSAPHAFGVMERGLYWCMGPTATRSGARADVEIGEGSITLRPYRIIRDDDVRFSEGLREKASSTATGNMDLMANDFLGFLLENGIEPDLK